MTTARFIPNVEAKRRIGKQVKTLEQLIDAARAKQSVAFRLWSRDTPIGYNGPHPAAFVANRIGTDLVILFRRGIYIYRPKPAKTKSIKKGFQS